MATSAEVVVDGEWLRVTLNAPDVPDGRLRFRVNRRYLLVWSDGAPHGRHHFIPFSQSVDPEKAEVRLANGVIDARLRLRKA